MNGVYAFGFLFMLPQLFVNYKVRVVCIKVKSQTDVKLLGKTYEALFCDLVAAEVSGASALASVHVQG